MSEDEIMEVKYVSGIQPFMDEEGETVLAVSWVECPMMKTKRITMRTAASMSAKCHVCGSGVGKSNLYGALVGTA